MGATARAQAGRAIEGSVGALACLFDRAGALLLPDHGALVVADLHLEKGSSRARRGAMLPPYDTRETLARLAPLVALYAPRLVVALGDSFHDEGGPSRLGEEERAALAALQAGRDWLWITGNHDARLPASIGGSVAPELSLGGARLRHEPAPGDAPTLCGHLHPAAKVRLRGRAVRRPCFATDGRLCVLPAFGAYAGGLNVCDRAFADLFPGPFLALALGDTRPYALDSRVLCAD